MMPRLFKQLLFQLDVDPERGTRPPSTLVINGSEAASFLASPSERPIHRRKRDRALELQARELLRQRGAEELARKVRVEWNPRLKTCAGRADYREKLISLNPLLLGDQLARTEPGEAKLECNKHSSLAGSIPKRSQRRAVVNDEIERTLRHELAHLLAQWRAGRRRIAPHGSEWRQACRDLGIADEARCHNLPFVTKAYSRRYIYRCPNCKEEFPRVRRIRRAIACLACCRKHNGGDFDPRFRLRLTAKL
jgi:predicted SprT family Zn-dependent metalloprotease